MDVPMARIHTLLGLPPDVEIVRVASNGVGCVVFSSELDSECVRIMLKGRRFDDVPESGSIPVVTEQELL